MSVGVQKEGFGSVMVLYSFVFTLLWNAGQLGPGSSWLESTRPVFMYE